MQKRHFILCIVLFHLIVGSNSWFGKHKKSKSDIPSIRESKFRPEKYNSVNVDRRKKKNKSDLCKSGKFSEKVKKLYNCNDYPMKSYIKSTNLTKVKKNYNKQCKDDNKYCATWSSLSECTANPSWMLVHCPIACDQCLVKCDDFDTYCEEWARAGECFTNREYMDIYCKKSCSLCQPSQPSAGVNCQDDHANCARWGRKGFCKNEYYQHFMMGKCKKTCQTCPV